MDTKVAPLYVHCDRACPVCGASLDALREAAGPDGPPEVAAWTICVYCLSWLVIVSLRPIGFRVVTAAEWREMPPADRADLDGVAQTVARRWASHPGRRRAMNGRPA